MIKWQEWLVGTALGRVVGAIIVALLGTVIGELTPLPEVVYHVVVPPPVDPVQQL